MLPFNMRDAIVASVLTSASHTIVLSVCLSGTAVVKEHLVWQVGVELIISCALNNLVNEPGVPHWVLGSMNLFLSCLLSC